MNKKQKKLLKEIKAAFNSVQLGDGTTLHQALAIDDYASPEEEKSARKLDIDIKWEDVSEEDIVEYSAISFLDAPGFRYYIPAYMSWAVKNYKFGSFDFLILDWILFSLDPGDNTEQAQNKLQKFKIFSQQQKEVICQFLEFMKEEAEDYLVAHDVAGEALQRYWGRFSPKKKDY